MRRHSPHPPLRGLAAPLAAVAGFLCLLAIFAFLVAPGLDSHETDLPGPREDPGWLDPTDYPPERGRPAPLLDPEALTPKPAALAQARTAYAQLCASCHGAAGHGDGPAAKGLQPAPRDFTRPEDWKLGSGLAAIYQTLDQGLPGTAMGSYRHLGRQERIALARVVQELGTFERATEDLSALAGSFRAPAEPSPNRIPVPQAMALLCREAGPPAPPVQGPAWAVTDPAKAARTLQPPGDSASDEAFLRKVAPSIQENGFAPGVLLLPPMHRRALMEALR